MAVEMLLVKKSDFEPLKNQNGEITAMESYNEYRQLTKMDAKIILKMVSSSQKASAKQILNSLVKTGTYVDNDLQIRYRNGLMGSSLPILLLTTLAPTKKIKHRPADLPMWIDHLTSTPQIPPILFKKLKKLIQPKI